MTVYSASSPGQPVTAPLEAAMNPSQAQPSKLPWQQILNQGAIPILLGLVGYHSAPGGRTLEGPATNGGDIRSAARCGTAFALCRTKGPVRRDGHDAGQDSGRADS